MRRIHVVASVAIIKHNKILLVQEGKKRCYKEWNFPGGHVDYGEDLIEAAKREAYEETGYRVKIKGLVGVYNYLSKRGKHIINFFFIGSIIKGKISFDGKEIFDVKWLSFDEIKKMKDNQLRTAKIKRKMIKDAKSKKLYLLDAVRDMIKR